MEIWLSVICIDLLPAELSKRRDGLEIPQPSSICLSQVCTLDLNLALLAHSFQSCHMSFPEVVCLEMGVTSMCWQSSVNSGDSTEACLGSTDYRSPVAGLETLRLVCWEMFLAYLLFSWAFGITGNKICL